MEYWIELAKLLERGGINALFLADTYGGYDTYEGSLDNCIRRAAQWPMTDPTIVCPPPSPPHTQNPSPLFPPGDSFSTCVREGEREKWLRTNKAKKPISAMAAVTKNLAFGITASTSFEPPFLLAKRFSTLDHFTRGRVGWNIVTGWKKTAFKAIGMESPIDHDERYLQADEYVRVLYK